MEESTLALLARYREYYDESQPDIQALKAVIAHLEAPLKQLEGEIKSCVVESGESVSGHGITVTYRRGYDRTKWNTKALGGYAIVHPEILEFRSVTKVGPTAAIKVE